MRIRIRWKGVSSPAREAWAVGAPAGVNEVRRFVTLIDALYEAKVRLICSAAASPEMLYVEGSGSFEFERTASRLREMQSEDWTR